jgi:hypothetical protein
MIMLYSILFQNNELIFNNYESMQGYVTGVASLVSEHYVAE